MTRNILNRFKPGIWVVTLVSFLNAAAFSLSLPFLSLYLYQDRHLSMTLVGLVLLISGLVSAVAQLFGGALSDHFGRRPILIGSILASILLYAVMALLVAASAPVVAIAASYAGVRSALMMMRPIVSATVADLSTRERLAETYGLLRIGQNVGWAAGPAIGGYLAAIISYAWLFGIGSLVLIIGLALAFFRLKESFGNTSEWTDVRSVFSVGADRRFLAFTGLSWLVFMVMGQMSSTLSVFTVDLVGFSTSQYGLLLTLNGLLVVAFQYPLTRLTNRAAKPTVMASGALLYALGFLVMGWVGSYSLALIAMVVITTGEMSFAPTSLAEVGELSRPAWRGRYMGFYGLSENLGLSIGPLIGGVLIDHFARQPLAIWGGVALIAVIAAVGFIRFRHWD